MSTPLPTKKVCLQTLPQCVGSFNMNFLASDGVMKIIWTLNRLFIH